MNSSKVFLNHLNKTRGMLYFNSDHDFYTALYARRASFQQDSGLGSHSCYRVTNQTANKYGTARSNISTVTNEGV